MPAFITYRIELCRADGATVVEYRKRKRPTTPKGFERQHNAVVSATLQELAYYRIEGWKRLTVTREEPVA
jgi:hypothetical protein